MGCSSPNIENKENTKNKRSYIEDENSNQENENSNLKIFENSDMQTTNNSFKTKKVNNGNYYMEKNNQINKTKIKESLIVNNPIMKTNKFINRVSRSICKIIIKENEGIKNGTGFLIKINTNNKNNKKFLMTNDHVVERKYIKNKKTIDVHYDNGFKQIKIVLDEYERIINSYRDIIDLTMIEIIEEDNIDDTFFLFPNYKYNEVQKIDEIYIPQYPADKEKYSDDLYYSEGPIVEVNKYKFNYDLNYKASTDFGSSGSPVFLKNTIEVIGIHFAGCISENICGLIYPILNIFKNNNETIYYESGNYYKGEWKNGLKHGKGILYYENGSILYDGYFIQDKFEGKGNYYYEDSNYYIEKWKNKKDEIIYAKGKLYDGDFIYHKSKGNKIDIYEYGNYYEGEWKNGKKHGKGIIYHKNGNILYNGDFIDDKFEGNGKYIYEDGDYYIGEFSNGLKNGQGKEVNRNGEIIYDGEFIDDERNGYFGEKKNGLFHGKGILYKNGKIRYKGDFKNNKYNGNGKYIFDGGCYYIGEFKNGMFHGKGELFYKDGEIKYSGDFKNNEIEYGKYNYRSGYYIGQFKKWMYHGKGTLYYKNGKIKHKGEFKNNKFLKKEYGNFNDKYEENVRYDYEDGTYYIGQTKNGLRHGKGKMYYENGNILYDGDFIEDNEEGNGKYYYENGEYYIGDWGNSLRNGTGKLYYKNGNLKYEGDFIEDNFEGKGKYYYRNGDIYEGEYQKGLRHGKGKVINKHGSLKYEGYFIDNKYEGQGILITPTGKYEGEFKNGMKHGQGKEYNREGILIRDDYYENGFPKSGWK